MSLSERLQSRWALSLMTGVPFGVGMAVYGLVDGRGWLYSVLMGLATGAFFGVIMGWFLVKQQNRLQAVLGTRSTADIRSVTRKALRGEAVDPEHRVTARQVAEVQLREVLRFRVLGLIVFGGAAIIGVIHALAGAPLFWLIAVAGVGMVLAEVIVPMRLRRRIAMLLGPTGAAR